MGLDSVVAAAAATAAGISGQNWHLSDLADLIHDFYSYALIWGNPQPFAQWLGTYGTAGGILSNIFGAVRRFGLNKPAVGIESWPSVSRS